MSSSPVEADATEESGGSDFGGFQDAPQERMSSSVDGVTSSTSGSSIDAYESAKEEACWK